MLSPLTPRTTHLLKKGICGQSADANDSLRNDFLQLYDLEAAKACGMTTVFVSSRPTEDGLPADGKPDYVDIVVADLLEFAQLVA